MSSKQIIKPFNKPTPVLHSLFSGMKFFPVKQLVKLLDVTHVSGHSQEFYLVSCLNGGTRVIWLSNGGYGGY